MFHVTAKDVNKQRDMMARCQCSNRRVERRCTPNCVSAAFPVIKMFWVFFILPTEPGVCQAQYVASLLLFEKQCGCKTA